jgi:hypothetical protein
MIGIALIVAASVGLFAALFGVLGGSTGDVEAMPPHEQFMLFKQLGVGQLVPADHPSSVCPEGTEFGSIIGTPLVHPETDTVVGRIDECITGFTLIDNGTGMEDDGFTSTGVIAFFTFNPGNGFYPEGTIVSKTLIGVTQPCYGACPTTTHSTTSIPPDNANNINTGASTDDFTNAVGRIRLSGSADVSGLDLVTGTGPVSTDCFWEIRF